jgi:hypothetical protein
MNGVPARGAPVTTDLPADATLVDLLDRLLAGGVAVCGDLVLSIADVPLVRIDLRALVAPADPPPRGRIAAGRPWPVPRETR